MSTMLRQECEYSVQEQMSDPEYCKAIAEYTGKLNSGFFGKAYVDVLGQKYRSGYDVYDTDSFARIHGMIMDGEIAVFQFYVGQTPPADSQIETQNEILSEVDGISDSKFWGGTQGRDGYISWDKPRHAVIYNKNSSRMLTIRGESPGKACAIEVGTTSFEKTWFYLVEQRQVARWPYRSEYITVLSKFFTGNNDPNFNELVSSAGDTKESFINPYVTWGFEKPASPVQKRIEV